MMSEDRSETSGRPEPAARSEAELALLRLAFQSERAFQPPPAPPPEIGALTRYLCGALPEEAARALERSLTARAASRQRLRQTRATLDALQNRPWTEVTQAAQGQDFTAQVARAWLEIVSERLPKASGALAALRTRTLTALRQQAMAGQIEAQTALALFRSFGQQLQAALRAPRLAQVMGAEGGGATVIGTLPPNVEIAPFAEVTPDGTFQAVLRAQDTAQRPSAALDGKEVRLALAVRGEVWPIAEGTFAGDRVELSVPGLRDVLDLPTAQLPPAYLHIHIGETRPPDSEPMSLLATIVDSQSVPTGASPEVVELRSRPQWQTGQFSVIVALSAVTAIAYADHLLILDAVVTEGGWQRLGAWPIYGWGSAPQTLTAACPGAPDTVLPTAAALRARLQAPVEAKPD
jgi:hypothetical protein